MGFTFCTYRLYSFVNFLCHERLPSKSTCKPTLWKINIVCTGTQNSFVNLIIYRKGSIKLNDVWLFLCAMFIKRLDNVHTDILCFIGVTIIYFLLDYNRRTKSKVFWHRISSAYVGYVFIILALYTYKMNICRILSLVQKMTSGNGGRRENAPK